MAEDDDVVGHELLDAVPRDWPVLLGALGRHQGGHPELAQTRRGAAQLTPDDAVVSELGEDAGQ
jgi:hypothetical protein